MEVIPVLSTVTLRFWFGRLRGSLLRSNVETDSLVGGLLGGWMTVGAIWGYGHQATCCQCKVTNRDSRPSKPGVIPSVLPSFLLQLSWSLSFQRAIDLLGWFVAVTFQGLGLSTHSSRPGLNGPTSVTPPSLRASYFHPGVRTNIFQLAVLPSTFGLRMTERTRCNSESRLRSSPGPYSHIRVPYT